jgi:thiamine-monophosphate kinase
MWRGNWWPPTSDLAAKGAAPVGVLLSYQLNGNEARFLEGLAQALAEYGVPLLGGDTVGHAGAQVLGLTALGRATCSPVPGRDGAMVGDAVYLTGPIGGAMVGLEALRAGRPEAESLAYRRPVARLAEGQALAPLVTAMMDVSDGLLLDASRMARASGSRWTCAPMPSRLPPERRDEAMRWGDDYQLLLTAPADLALPVHLHRIGVVVAQGDAPVMIDGAVPSGHWAISTNRVQVGPIPPGQYQIILAPNFHSPIPIRPWALSDQTKAGRGNAGFSGRTEAEGML